jgi:hypothetical protein
MIINDILSKILGSNFIELKNDILYIKGPIQTKDLMQIKKAREVFKFKIKDIVIEE